MQPTLPRKHMHSNTLGTDACREGLLSTAFSLLLAPGDAVSEAEWAVHQEELRLHSGDEGWAGENSPALACLAESASTCFF